MVNKLSFIFFVGKVCLIWLIVDILFVNNIIKVNLLFKIVM